MHPQTHFAAGAAAAVRNETAGAHRFDASGGCSIDLSVEHDYYGSRNEERAARRVNCVELLAERLRALYCTFDLLTALRLQRDGGYDEMSEVRAVVISQRRGCEVRDVRRVVALLLEECGQTN